MTMFSQEQRRQEVLYASSSALALTGGLGLALALHTPAGMTWAEPAKRTEALLAIAFVVSVFTLVSSVMDLSQARHSPLEDLFAIIKAQLMTFVVVLGFWFVAHLEPPPRLTTALALAFGVAFVFAARRLARRLVRAVYSSSKIAIPLVVEGFNPLGQYLCDRVVDEIKQYDFVGFLDDVKTGEQYRGYPLLGGSETIPELAAQFPGLEVAVTLPDADSERIDHTIRLCEQHHVRWKVMPPIFRTLSVGLVLDMVGVIPLIGPRNSNIEGLNYVIKRTFDIAVASMLLLITAPVMFCTALLIRLCEGKPVIFRQTRVGMYGKPFDILKFRTMAPAQSDSIHRQYMRELISQERPAAAFGANGTIFKITSDPRTTRLGRWIRRLSIDELPQLINVLLGEMSLIGPRPSVFYELEFYQNWHRRRLQALPGITGLWQVSGRNRLSFEEMVRLDVKYMEEWSLAKDMAILARTFATVLHGDGA